MAGQKLCLVRLLLIVAVSTLFGLPLSDCSKIRRNQFNVYNVNAHASASDSHNSPRLTLLRAQCKAVCMRKMIEHDHSLNEAQKVAALSSEKLMETCLAKQTCAACERGCNAPLMREQAEATALIVCPQQCKILPENLVKPCTDSCRLLNDMMDERRHVDPLSPIVRLNQTSRKCTVNFDCPASQRCCRRQCGACEQLVPYPTILDVNERESVDAASAGNRQIGFDVEWTVPDNIPVDGPIVYILDVRSHFGSAFDDDAASPWKTVLMTTNKGAYLGGVRIGELYKFRLAAVSPDGTQGYSTPTQPRRSSLEPQAPSPPENLREESRYVKPTGLIDVQFGWEQPANTDLEVTKYKLFWFQKSDMADGRIRASREVKKTVAASQLSFVLEDLQADTVHCFAVQAICDYYEKKLRSQRTVVCVNTSSEISDEVATTSALTATTPGYGDDSEEFDVTQDYADWDGDNDNRIQAGDVEDYDSVHSSTESVRGQANEETNELDVEVQVTPFSILNGSLTSVFYANNILHAEISWTHVINSFNSQNVVPKYSVIWRPLVCMDVQGDNMRPHTTTTLVTESRMLMLEGLRFACQYQVVIRVLATSGLPGNETSFSFGTPRCNDVTVRDGRGPTCATTTTPKAHVLTIHTPKNVQVRLIESWTRQSWTKSYHAYVNWTASASHNVHSYRIIYGRKTIQSASNAPKMEKGGAITKVVTTTYTSLLDLEADTTYVIQLQALSDSGDSRIVQVHFTTFELASGAQPASATSGRPFKSLASGAGSRQFELITLLFTIIVQFVWPR